MPFNEALFWFGITAFGTGLYFLFEATVKRLYSVGVTIVGTLACVYSVYRHYHPEAPVIHLWVILLVLTWSLLGYSIYVNRVRHLPPPPHSTGGRNDETDWRKLYVEENQQRTNYQTQYAEAANKVLQLEEKLSARPEVPLSALQCDVLLLSSELLHFLKTLGPMPAPKYTVEDIDKMTSAQMEKLIKTEDGDFAEACEYHKGDGTFFVQTANPYNNQITAHWKRLLPWFQKVASSYALEFKDKVEKMRNRLAVEGVAPHVLLLPVEGRDGEKNMRAIAAALWAVAYKIGENEASL